MYELAKRIACSILAVAQGTTAAIVRGLLPLNPLWVERVAHLAAHFRAIGAGRPPKPDAGVAEPTAQGPEPADTGGDLRNVLSAYQQLWDFVQLLKVKGISMDAEFCERVEREWSVSILLSYMRSVDRTLQDGAAEAQAAAAQYLVSASSGERGTV